MAYRDYDDDYPTCGRTYVSLLFHHEHLAASEATTALDIEPTRTWLARGREVSDGLVRAARPNGWCLSSESASESRDFRRHLDYVLDRVADKRNALDSLRREGWTSHVSVYWASRRGHGGPSLWSEQGAVLGVLGLEIFFDIYFIDEEDIDEPLVPGELTANFRRAVRHWRRFGVLEQERIEE